MKRESHAQFCERLAVKFRRPTHPHIWGKSRAGKNVVRQVSAAKLAVILAGESPANRGGPVAVVVISSNGKGDRPVESLEVKAPVAAGKAANLADLMHADA